MSESIGLLAHRLRDEHLPILPEDVTDQVFNKAWEDGHANGIHEVEIHYAEIAGLVSQAYRAGHAVGFPAGWDKGYGDGYEDGERSL